MTERDSSYPADPRFILRRYLGRYADAIVANSDKGAHYWREAGALGRVVVTSNIVHPTVPWTDAPDSTRVVAIGRLEPQKNVGAIVRAFVRLAERREDLTFCIIGEGSQRGRLEAIVRNSSGANRIAFLGFRADVAQQIRDATLVVSMSHHEGQPNVILESIAGGRLVVVSDIPEHRELLGPDYPFYVAHRNDPQHIAVVIEAAVRVAADVSPLAHSRERLVRFTPEAVARQYLNLFATVLEDSR